MTSIELLGGEPVATLGDGRIVFLGQRRTVEAHAGAILCAALATEGSGLLSGGDDGRLRLTRQDGTETLFQGSKWIDAVASRRAGAYYSSRRVFLFLRQSTITSGALLRPANSCLF
ncbi:WD40 repeat domain-containing protein [Tardiphaga sp. 709]|uniref:WD40 repeat domain-containing protein n=1 Tax=Tardiphaga sp. 709 TaxID=3076039 RepID=UPI0028EE2035|nr:WD40 repeat domain-containing protein [Tardiphaga sp. 709]WNV11813.1 WD40 repeat domain-containing protein [Tardiphaga sp. 709]